MTTGVTGNFLLNSKVALEIQKTQVAIATRIYSQIVEDLIRANKNYNQLLALRAMKCADRKKTATLVKKLLSEQLKIAGVAEEDFKSKVEAEKKKNDAFQLLLLAEKKAFKTVEPELAAIPVYGWMLDVRGLGTRFAVKLISKIRNIERFENPSKLRTYCGTAPGMKKVLGQEANFNPELKGILLGQVADSFIKSKSQYKQVYDEKKAYYFGLHPEALVERANGKTANGDKLTHDDWTKIKIHNYAKKTMINRFLVDLWMAWYLSEGKTPPKNPWIADQPHHSLDPMIVPYVPKPEKEPKTKASLKVKKPKKKKGTKKLVTD